MLKDHEHQDSIPECIAARWAYRAAIIPILGLFLYLPIAFFALYRIGQGRAGLFWLSKGFWRMLRMTATGIILLAVGWFCPYVDYRNDGFGRYYQGLSMRSFSYPPKSLKVGHWRYYFSNGQLEREGKYWFDKWDGKWVDWYKTGQKRNEINYIDGEAYGKMIFWWDNGQKCEEGELRNGQREGVWIYCYRSGNKWGQEEYKNGVLDGKCMLWYEDGKIQIEGYCRSRDIGSEEWAERDKQQEIILNDFYVFDLVVGMWQLKGGSHLFSWQIDYFAQDLKVGEWKYFDKNGKLEKTENYNADGELINTVNSKDSNQQEKK